MPDHRDQRAAFKPLPLSSRSTVPRGRAGLVIGEHGPNQVPLFSSISVRGENLVLSADRQSAVNDKVRGWFQRYIALKRLTGSVGSRGVLSIVPLADVEPGALKQAAETIKNAIATRKALEGDQG